jgi:hypothetical protein
VDAHAKPDFENSAAALPWSPAPQAPQNLKFERPDWTAFRTLEGLQQKAGVPRHKLCRLVVKEITDNALDEADKARVGELPGGGYFVEDDGGGIDPTEVARLFSVARPLVSTKLLRLPTRGALGNGLRVVAGAVLASGGTLSVTTRNRRLELKPEFDGTTTVVSATEVEFPTGTRIEICFGSALPADPAALAWAQIACDLARGKVYVGRSSPHWYDGPHFHELLLAGGARPVREVIAELDGCTGATAGVIVAAAKLNRSVCNSITREQATALLEAARRHAKPVSAERLGAIGPDGFFGCAYAQITGVAKFGAVAPVAEIPFVVETWAQKAQRAGNGTRLTVCVNRTPVTGEIYAARDKRDINAWGCGLANTIAQAPIDAQFSIVINITTPYMPITSDGKAPNLQPFLDEIRTAGAKVIRKAHRPTAGERVSQKDIVLDNLDDAIATVRGEEEYRFNQRQILYVVRPTVRDETGKTLTTENFNSIITNYEAEHGEIEGMYREPRGSIYHPHRRQEIPLGTLTVEDYERPIWTFNKIMYIEKEGFSEALKDSGWSERHDCALMSSKGFSTRAARDLIDKLAEHDEPCTVYCAHDADAYGTMIYQTLQAATRARGARKVKIVNLGLEPWEAVAAGLEVEDVDAGEKRKAVADYVLERDDGAYWEEWLQTHRVELNAMTTPEFIAWLDRKMAEHGEGKLIPPPEVLATELEQRLQAAAREVITERILREADLEGQIRKALKSITRPTVAALKKGIAAMFGSQPKQEWRKHIEAVVAKLIKKGPMK